MNRNKFLAKSAGKNSKEETIQEHTDKLLKEFDTLNILYPNIHNLNWDILKNLEIQYY